MCDTITYVDFVLFLVHVHVHVQVQAHVHVQDAQDYLVELDVSSFLFYFLIARNDKYCY